MKIGIRTPSLKKSFKASTTGKAKRAVKSTVNPLYGKKGMGYINNPKKAVYNKIYNKTSFSAFKGSSKGIGALFMGLFYLTWMMLKWIFVGTFYLCKWTFYSLPVWIFNTSKRLIQEHKDKKAGLLPKDNPETGLEDDPDDIVLELDKE